MDLLKSKAQLKCDLDIPLPYLWTLGSLDFGALGPSDLWTSFYLHSPNSFSNLLLLPMYLILLQLLLTPTTSSLRISGELCEEISALFLSEKF